MSLSIFYAQVIGIWLFLLGLGMLVHHQRFKKAVMETCQNAGLLSFTGLANLAVGLLIVLSHNIWVSSWPVVITIIGWIFIIQGVLRIFWPDSFTKMMKDCVANAGYTVCSWICFLVGLYLIWVAFAL